MHEAVNDQVNILGVAVDRVDFATTLECIQRWIPETTQFGNEQSIEAQQSGPHQTCTHQICTVNPEFVVDARRDARFAKVLREASLCVPDGTGILWAARIFGQPLTERVTGSDGIYRICERAAMKGWRVFLLGAAPGVASQAAIQLGLLYPGLRIVGTHSGRPDQASWPAIKSLLQGAKPDILFVAFGHPNQDLWISAHKSELPAKVAIGVGGALDFVAGKVPRAPIWMREVGVEWLFRLVRQPWRIRRMIKIPLFVVLVLMGKFSK